MVASDTHIRVRYADTDQMRMVYYARFYEYFEQGRSDLLRKIGMPYPEIERLGFYLPVVESHARYLQSARYDDHLIITTMVREMPQVRVRIEYTVKHAEREDVLVEGYTIHGFISATTGKPTRPPERFLGLLAEAGVSVERITE